MASGDKSSVFQAFQKGANLSRRLGLANPDFPRQVDAVIDLVKSDLSKSRTPYEIFFHPRTYQSGAFIGTIEAFENTAHIYYDRDQSRCWRRFVVAKEMCHLLFHAFGKHHLASDPTQIEQLLIQILVGLENADFNDHIASTETCSIYMALEILLPYSERRNVEKLISEKKTHRQIAEAYLIPELMIGVYLGSAYSATMAKAYESLKTS